MFNHCRTKKMSLKVEGYCVLLYEYKKKLELKFMLLCGKDND